MFSWSGIIFRRCVIMLVAFILITSFPVIFGRQIWDTILWLESEQEINREIDAKTKLLSRALNFSLGPGQQLTCVTLVSDESDFGSGLLIRIQQNQDAPSVHRIQHALKKQCEGLIVAAANTTSLVSTLRRFTLPYNCRLVCFIYETNQKELDEIIAKVELFRDSETVLFVWNNLSYAYQLPQPVRKFLPIHIDENTTPWIYNREGITDFQGREVKFTTTNCSLFVRVEFDEKEGFSDHRLFGTDTILFLEMAKRLNFTYKYVTPSPGHPIGEVVNGVWKGGILERIFKGEVDVAFCGLLNEWEKSKYGIIMSDPIQDLCLTFAVVKPHLDQGGWHTMLKPFQPELWLTLILVVVIVSLSLVSIATFMDTFLDYNIEYLERFENSFMLIWGILVNSSWPGKDWNRGPVRHVVTWWVFFAFLVSCVYSSKLTSFLVNPSYTKKPTNVEDLVTMGCTWPVSSAVPVHRFLNLNDPLHAKWNKTLELVSEVEFLERIFKQEKNEVVFGTKINNMFYPFEANFPLAQLESAPSMEVMDKCVTRLDEAFAFRSGSPFQSGINHFIRKQLQTGIRQKSFSSTLMDINQASTIFKKWAQTRSDRTAAMPINMFDLVGVFEFLVNGLLVALVVFILEMIHGRLSFSRCKCKAFVLFQQRCCCSAQPHHE